MRPVTSFLAISLAIPLSLAQFPSTPTGLTTVNSKVNPEVYISFKETTVCEKTTGVKSYSGFVHLPGKLTSDIGGYDINTYFIYFEARNNASTAPLAVYLAGGPGESSIYAALSSENGPCYVNINGTDTINNTWSFNNNANVLYIDQPSGTGYSYDKLTNATYDLLSGGLPMPTDFQNTSLPAVNGTFGYGTYGSQDPSKTANNTVQASRALWYFGEHWLSSFPNYTTQSNQISFWGNSYGGYWVPETAVQYSKNLKNLTSAHPLKSKNITVDAIGITNGCVDFETGAIGYPDFAYNNTYGVRYGSEALYNQVVQNLTAPGGCLDLVKQCRALGQASDPDFTGSNATVNELCTGAFYSCNGNVISAFPDLNERVAFDIAIPAPDPCSFYLPVNTYLNTGTIQQSLGVPVNWTIGEPITLALFGLVPPSPDRPLSASTGDAARQNGLPNIEYLLASNVKVAFIFGDRDYRCPWTGGESTALATNWTHQSNFVNAGYQQLQGITTPVADGGLMAVVKQYSLFSFTRILDAGHTVSAYAPETVYRIFDRTLRGVDVVAGTQSVTGDYGTTGPKDSYGWRNTLPSELPPTCMVDGKWTDSNPFAAIMPLNTTS